MVVGVDGIWISSSYPAGMALRGPFDKRQCCQTERYARALLFHTRPISAAMPAPTDCRRLGLALLLSLLLHAAWLIPGFHGPAPQAGLRGTAEIPLVLTTRLSPAENAPPAEPVPETSTHQSPPAPQAQADSQGYFSAEQLSRPARPLGAINLDIPEAQLLTAPGTLVLTLWIDERGQVMSFKVDAPDLPEEYTTAVAEAFSAARFAPGEIRGRKVSSVLKVEITHDAAPGQRP